MKNSSYPSLYFSDRTPNMENMKTLQNLISPISIKKFSSEIYNKKAFHIKGFEDKHSNLLSWQSLNETLNTTSHLKNTCRMYKDGKPTPFADSFDMIKNTQKGATLVVENIDRINKELGDLHDCIENELGEKTRSNLYLSSPSIKGFDFHYDTHDFFILQLFGKKRWKVYPTTIEQPLFFLKEHATNKPPKKSSMYLECVLEQGDVLYVPKGHWHEVKAEGDDLSVHLTLAVFVRTGIDFLNWLTDELREITIFRSAFPLSTVDKQKSLAHLENIRDVLNEIIKDPETYNNFIQARYAGFQNRTAFNFPFHIFQNSVKENKNNLLVKSNTPVHISYKEKKIFLTSPNSLISFGIELKTTIEYIYDDKNSDLSIETIISKSTDKKSAGKLIEKLISEGLLRVKK